MRKGRDGGKREKNWKKKEKTDENSGHYVIASSRPPECRPLERRTLAPKLASKNIHYISLLTYRNVSIYKYLKAFISFIMSSLMLATILV